MDGREFLDAARFMVRQPYQSQWRSAASRASYALLHEAKAALERWGVPAPPRDRVHMFVRVKFANATDQGARDIGAALDRCNRLRNEADYDLLTSLRFCDDLEAREAIKDAKAAIALLDAIEADPARRAAVIASLPKLPYLRGTPGQKLLTAPPGS